MWNLSNCCWTENEYTGMKIVISGYGRMGHMIEKVLERRGLECVGKSEDITSFPKEIAAESVCIDFTFPDSFRKNYRWLAENFKAVVVGTTGWYDIKDEVFRCFRENNTTMIWASNFSLGVNVLAAAVKLVSGLLAPEKSYTPYIVEKHHIHKLDAPSGTAKTLARDIQEYMGLLPETTSVRAGEIPGIHTVVFEGLHERITLEHEAFDREGLAEGAVQAALMTGNVTGVHEFGTLLLSRNG